MLQPGDTERFASLCQGQLKENLHPSNERNYPLYIGIGTVVLIVIIVVIVLAIRR